MPPYESCACMLSCFSHVRLFGTLWTVASQAFCTWYSPGKNICPAPRDSPDPGITPASLCLLQWQAGSLSLAPPGLTNILFFLVLIWLVFMIRIVSDFFPAISLVSGPPLRCVNSRGKKLGVGLLCIMINLCHMCSLDKAESYLIQWPALLWWQIRH